jgi:hypothetical protein
MDALRARVLFFDVFGASLLLCTAELAGLSALAVPIETLRVVGALAISWAFGLAVAGERGLIIGIALLVNSFATHALFALTQGLLADGVARTQHGGRLEVGRSVRVALARPSALAATVMLVALQVSAWGLLCGVGALIGIRRCFVAVPVCVVEKRDAGAAVSRSTSLTAQSSNGVLGLTVIFALLSLAISFGTLVALSLLTEGALRVTLSPTATIVSKIIAGALEGALFVVWAAMTCVAHQRLTRGAEESDAGRVADVF